MDYQTEVAAEVLLQPGSRPRTRLAKTPNKQQSALYPPRGGSISRIVNRATVSAPFLASQLFRSGRFTPRFDLFHNLVPSNPRAAQRGIQRHEFVPVGPILKLDDKIARLTIAFLDLRDRAVVQMPACPRTQFERSEGISPHRKDRRSCG